jgi:hypothetical protein
MLQVAAGRASDAHPHFIAVVEYTTLARGSHEALSGVT